jgi:hypothetical protein
MTGRRRLARTFGVAVVLGAAVEAVRQAARRLLA